MIDRWLQKQRPRTKIFQWTNKPLFFQRKNGISTNLLRRFTTAILTTAAVIAFLTEFLKAQTLETIYSENTGLLRSGSLVKGSDGALYGATREGGACNLGTLFKVMPDGAIVTIMSFNGVNGAYPVEGLTQDEGGNFIGVTERGGPTRSGIVFRLSADGQFQTIVKNAGRPNTPLIRAADGNFYGGAGGLRIIRMTPQGSFTTLAEMSFNPREPATIYPGSIRGRLLQASDGNFYGVSGDGGRYRDGAIFRVTPQGAISWLHHFGEAATSPTYPEGPLAEMGGKLYLATKSGGTEGRGTVCRLTFDGGLQILHQFWTGNGTPASPGSGLMRAKDGNLYGATVGGGNAGNGAIFRITPQEIISRIGSFNGTWVLNQPYAPQGELLDGGNGSFYGVCVNHVYRMSSGGEVSSFAHFNQAGGRNPSGTLTLEAGGSLLGSTIFGGENGAGTLFRLHRSGLFSRVASFPATGYGCSNGSPVSFADGSIFGSAYGDFFQSGRGASCIYQLSPVGVFSKWEIPQWMSTSLHVAGDGWLYGASNYAFYRLNQIAPSSPTPVYWDPGQGLEIKLQGLSRLAEDRFIAPGRGKGALSGFGEIYSVGKDGSMETLAKFNGTDGMGPSSELIKGPDGAWYGTTSGSLIESEHGTVYRYSPQAGISTLWRFKTPRYAGSAAPLLRDEWGNFWGTTVTGGSADKGTVFRMSPAGELSIAWSFTGPDGARPLAGLVKGPQGSLYGTTSAGGNADGGTVFKISANGTFTSLVSFNWQNGASPEAGLTLGSDGAFYGTTSGGGPGSGSGTIFRMTPGGLHTILYTFPRPGGQSHGQPRGELTEGNDGAFYGTASSGGTGGGSVFRITKEGTFTTLHTMPLDRTEGVAPLGKLLKDAAGDFYGVTTAGVSSEIAESVFRVTSSGAFTTLSVFNNSGPSPKAGLIMGRDGNLYGTTADPGYSDSETGVFFRLTPAGERTTIKAFGAGDALTVRSVQAALIDGGDGYFYGTGRQGSDSSPAVFRISPAGEVEVLAELENSPDSANFYPSGGLAVGSDGHLYGTTTNAGISLNGTAYGGKPVMGSIYRLSLAGEFTTLATFDGIHAARPVGTPVFGNDGNLYGAASQLSLWRLRMPPAFAEPAAGITAKEALIRISTLPVSSEPVSVFVEYSRRPDLADAIRLSVAAVPAGSGSKEVSIPLSGLDPDTVYYFRTITESAGTPVFSPISSFATLTGIQGWRKRYFGTVQDSGEAANMADPDHDGLVNLLEYALAGDPTASTPSSGEISRTGSGWRFQYSRNASAQLDGVVCKVQFRGALEDSAASWTGAGLAETVTARADGQENVSVDLPANTERGFLRIQISQE